MIIGISTLESFYTGAYTRRSLFWNRKSCIRWWYTISRKHWKNRSAGWKLANFKQIFSSSNWFSWSWKNYTLWTW